MYTVIDLNASYTVAFVVDVQGLCVSPNLRATTLTLAQTERRQQSSQVDQATMRSRCTKERRKCEMHVAKPQMRGQELHAGTLDLVLSTAPSLDGSTFLGGSAVRLDEDRGDALAEGPSLEPACSLHLDG